MGIISRVIMTPFWQRWEERFIENQDKYITPDESVVVQEAQSINFSESEDDMDVVETVWTHVYWEINYVLSKEWKTPKDTIKERTGDCEDLVFLMLSIFPNVGIESADMVIGDMKRLDGRGGPHVWIEYDGEVIDPTGIPESIEGIDYDAVERFNINYNND